MTKEPKTSTIEAQRRLSLNSVRLQRYNLIKLNYSDKKLILSNLDSLKLFENKVFDLQNTGLFRRLTLSYPSLVGCKVVKEKDNYLLFLKTKNLEIKTKIKR